MTLGMRRVGHHLELTRQGRIDLKKSEAEFKRRDYKLLEEIQEKIRILSKKHEREMKPLEDEWQHALRAKPGTKYDITARKGKRV